MPRLTWSIDVGHVITLIVTAVALIAFTVRLEAKVDFIDENGSKITRELRSELHSVQTDLALTRQMNADLKEDIQELKVQIRQLLDTRR